MTLFLKKCQWIPIIVSCTFIIISILEPNAYAAEEPSKGRVIWDNIMLWFNFGVLVFLFIKYAKKPLMGFLRGESNKIEENLTDVETKLKNTKSIMDSETVNLKDLDGRIQEMREDIIALSQREKERIIEKTKITASQMIEDANKESTYKLDIAKRAIEAEMMDIALTIVEGRLKGGMKSEDNELLIDDFLSSVTTAKRYFN